jgi:hypothetical protein
VEAGPIVSDATEGWFETINNNLDPSSEGFWSIFRNGEGLTVTWSPIPEPSVITIVPVMLACSAFRSRRRCRNSTGR